MKTTDEIREKIDAVDMSIMDVVRRFSDLFSGDLGLLDFFTLVALPPFIVMGVIVGVDYLRNVLMRTRGRKKRPRLFRVAAGTFMWVSMWLGFFVVQSFYVSALERIEMLSIFYDAVESSIVERYEVESAEMVDPNRARLWSTPNPEASIKMLSGEDTENDPREVKVQFESAEYRAYEVMEIDGELTLLDDVGKPDPESFER